MNSNRDWILNSVHEKIVAALFLNINHIFRSWGVWFAVWLPTTTFTNDELFMRHVSFESKIECYFSVNIYIMPMGWCVECTSHAYLAHSASSINAESLIRFRNFWFDWKIKDKLKFCALLIQFSINFWLKRILREILQGIFEINLIWRFNKHSKPSQI